MSAVAEAPPVDLNNFKMPTPMRGQTVQWYPHANKSDEVEIAFVTRTGHRNLVLNINGVPRAGVPHISDPRLAVNEHRRENGAWDFCDSDRDMIALKHRVESLEQEVADLKSLFNEPAKKGK